jgi:hypothetical protein
MPSSAPESSTLRARWRFSEAQLTEVPVCDPLDMKWLLTTAADIDTEAVERELEAVGGKLETRDPVPLGESEQVLYAEGPEDLRHTLSRSKLGIKVSPSSKYELY